MGSVLTLGLRGLLDEAVRDDSRSNGCAVAGCDAVCREALLQCRLALGEHTSHTAGGGLPTRDTPQRSRKSPGASHEVVSPFMLAVE